MVPGLERANHTAWRTATQGRADTALAHSDTKMALATYGRSLGEQRRKDLAEAVTAFCGAVKTLTGIS